jgi:hypothetical protein
MSCTGRGGIIQEGIMAGNCESLRGLSRPEKRTFYRFLTVDGM